MVLLRRVIGDALRARRQEQHRTLREVSTAANVSLGYLSEIERGQKEASSELLAAICDALGAQLSELLREVSDTLILAEQVDGVLDPKPRVPSGGPVPTGGSVRPTGDGQGAGDRERRTAAVPAARPASDRVPAQQPAEREPAAAQPASAAAPVEREPAARLSPHAHSSLGTARREQILRRLGGAAGDITVSIRRPAPLKVAPVKATLSATRGSRPAAGTDRTMVPVG